MKDQAKVEWICPKCGQYVEVPVKICPKCGHVPDINPLGEDVPRHPNIPRQGTYVVTVEVNDFLMKTTNLEDAIRDALSNSCMKVLMIAQATAKDDHQSQNT